MPLVVAAILALVLLAPSASRADAYDVNQSRAFPVKMLHKLGRGLTNICKSPTEIPYNMIKEGSLIARDGGSWLDQELGSSIGFFTGIGYMVARIGVGVVETVTFFAPIPPLMEPAAPPSVLQLSLDGLPEDP